MSDSSKFVFDLTAMEKRLILLTDGGMKAAKKGMWEGAALLKKFADEIAPKTPHLHGNLRGDSVRGVKAKGSSKSRKDWWPKTAEESRSDGLAVLVTYAAPYAARWHEAVGSQNAFGDPINWSEDGVGPKYVEAKMAREDLRNKIYQLVADVIKEGLKNA